MKPMESMGSLIPVLPTLQLKSFLILCVERPIFRTMSVLFITVNTILAESQVNSRLTMNMLFCIEGKGRKLTLHDLKTCTVQSPTWSYFHIYIIKYFTFSMDMESKRNEAYCYDTGLGWETSFTVSVSSY